MNNFNSDFKNVEGIRIIQHTLPHTIQKMEIIPIGDVHVGDEFSDLKMFKNVVDYVMAKPNRYVILNGDLMDMALTTSVSDSYGAVLSPSQQIKKVADILRPLKKRILGMLGGNHEFRVYKSTGIDISRYLALELGIEHLYCDNSFMLFVKVGESQTSRPSKIKQQVYSIFVQHGHGGGRKNGGKLNRLNDADGIIADADLYIMGHVHVPISNVNSTFKVDTQNMTISRHNKHFLLHNSYLSFGGYGLTHGYAPSAKEISYATFHTRGNKRVQLTIGSQ